MLFSDGEDGQPEKTPVKSCHAPAKSQENRLSGTNRGII